MGTDIDAGLSNRLKAQAYGIGFNLAGLTRLGPAETVKAFDDWIMKGYSGEMAYLPKGAEKALSSASMVSRAVVSG